MTKRAAVRRKKKKKDRNRAPVQLAALKDWDRSLAKGELVVFSRDYPTLNVYKISEVNRRYIYPEDILNNPKLHLKGFKVGDEYAPLLVLQLYRPAPEWRIVGPPVQIKTVDAFLAYRLSPGDLDPLFKNLAELREELDANSIPEG